MWKPLFDGDAGGSSGGDAGAAGDGTLLGGAGGEGAQQQQAQQTPPPPAGEQQAQGQQQQAQQTPADYQPFTVPEGMQYDTQQATEFGALAKELGLNQSQAQKLVDHYVARWVGAQDEFEQRLQAERSAWVDGIKAHAEYGGAKLGESLGYAGRFINAFGGDALKKALDITGAGDHPAIFEAFVKAGKLMSEDSFASSGTAGDGKQKTFSDLAKVMYPNM